MTTAPAPRPPGQLCPLCGRDDTVEVVVLAPGAWRYTCSNHARHPTSEPFTWESSATVDARAEPEGKAAELGLYDDLPACLRQGEPFVEYGVVEDRYAMLRPEVFERLIAEYGHTRLSRNSPYTASTFIAKALAALASRGELLVAWGPATGHWAYNGTISYWALPPGPADPDARQTYERATSDAAEVAAVEADVAPPASEAVAQPVVAAQPVSTPSERRGSVALDLPSGLSIEDPLARLFSFSAEYPYYDGIPSADPYEIDPLDVLATVSVNSFINTADKVRSVHLAMSESCRESLLRIQPDADLLEADDEVLGSLRDLLAAAVRARGVFIASATKVLHRKRPRLIPMLDSVVLGHYLSGPERRRLLLRTLERSTPEAAADAAIVAVASVRADLVSTADALRALQQEMADAGFDLSLVRILDILVWTEVEPRGVYRQTGDWTGGGSR